MFPENLPSNTHNYSEVYEVTPTDDIQENMIMKNLYIKSRTTRRQTERGSAKGTHTNTAWRSQED